MAMFNGKSHDEDQGQPEMPDARPGDRLALSTPLVCSGAHAEGSPGDPFKEPGSTLARRLADVQTSAWILGLTGGESG